ncbi:MAG: hypothetical protein OXN84_02840 [Albidovulum sp.]|nr:hypothetical protein [Albidovulum sp.]
MGRGNFERTLYWPVSVTVNYRESGSELPDIQDRARQLAVPKKRMETRQAEFRTGIVRLTERLVNTKTEKLCADGHLVLPQGTSNWHWPKDTLEAQRRLYDTARAELIDCYRKTCNGRTYFDQANTLIECSREKAFRHLARIRLNIANKLRN